MCSPQIYRTHAATSNVRLVHVVLPLLTVALRTASVPPSVRCTETTRDHALSAAAMVQTTATYVSYDGQHAERMRKSLYDTMENAVSGYLFLIIEFKCMRIECKKYEYPPATTFN